MILSFSVRSFFTLELGEDFFLLFVSVSLMRGFSLAVTHAVKSLTSEE